MIMVDNNLSNSRIFKQIKQDALPWTTYVKNKFYFYK